MMTYMDNCATSPVSEGVADEIYRLLKEVWGNPSSLHLAGRKAQDIVRESRLALANLLRVKPEEITFNSCATEGNNQVLRHYKGQRILSCVTEHPSVLRTLEQLAKEGSSVDLLPVDEKGQIDEALFRDKLTKETALVSIMHVNNETGAIHDIAGLRRIMKEVGSRARLHVDLVQSFGKLPQDLAGWQVDYATMSPHKVHGPKGLGVLFVKKGLRLDPLIRGGGQEEGLRAGTHNVAYIGSMRVLAEELAESQGAWGRVKGLKADLAEGLAGVAEKVGTGFVVNGDLAKDSPYILNVSFPGHRAEILLRLLEEKGVLVSTGSACSSRNQKDSHVLTAMGLSKDRIKGSIRLGLSDQTGPEDIAASLEAFAYALSFGPGLKS